MYEPDADVARWGLNLLDVDQLFSSSYYADSSHHDVDINHEQYCNDSLQDAKFSRLKNEERYSHTFQEELSQLALDNGTELISAEGDTWQVSTGFHDWSSTPISDCYDGKFSSTGRMMIIF